MAERPFRDRRDAGRQLATRVESTELADAIVLALPRGGVPVGFEVARALGRPMEVFVARKLGAPGQPELGIGAIAEWGGRFVDDAAVAALRVSEEQIKQREADESLELARRVAFYRRGRPLPSVQGRDVVLVDDGLATGVTARAALGALRSQDPRRLVLAVPVGAQQSIEALGGAADEVVCVVATDHLGAVGLWYDEFDPTSDEEVLSLLAV